MTDPISNERLAEMLAGLEGVTPGPWGVWREPTFTQADAIRELTFQVESTPIADFAKAVYLLNAGGKCPATTGCGPSSAANAAHIARCDPDTIRSLIEEVQASRRQSPAGVGSTASCPTCHGTGDHCGNSDFGQCDDCGGTGILTTLALSTIAAQPAGVEPVAWPLSAALKQAEAYISEYEFDDCDGGYYSPAEVERQIMIDMVNGLFSEDAFVSAVRQAFASPPKAVTITDEMVERVFNAAWGCPHSIDGSAVTLRIDPTKPGNALSQLRRRLAAALSSEANNG